MEKLTLNSLSELGWAGLDWTEMGWTGMGWAGLDWTGLGMEQHTQHCLLLSLWACVPALLEVTRARPPRGASIVG